MKDNLNSRQKLFCKYLLQGKTATEAAVRAGYSPKFARNNAPKLLHNTTIQRYLSEIQDAITQGNIAKLTEKKEILSAIARSERRIPVTAREQTLAIAELNKMEGDYAPDKHATLGNIIVEVVYRDRPSVTRKLTEKGDS